MEPAGGKSAAEGKSPVPTINLDAEEEHTPPLQPKTHAPAGSIDPLTPAQLNSINSGKGNRVQVLYNGCWDVDEDEDADENSDSELRRKLRRVHPEVIKDYVFPPQKLSEGRLISTRVGEPPKELSDAVGKFYIHDSKPGYVDMRRMSQGEGEFSCLDNESRMISIINNGNEHDVIVKIKDIRLTIKDLHTLTSSFGYDSFDLCLDAKIIDARIYDMRAKVPNDKRLFGYVYLENTDMSARFQFTQIDKAELSTAEELHRRTVGFTYVQHQMVFIPMRVNTHWFLVVLNSALRVVQVLNSDEKFNADVVHIVRSMIPGLYCHLEQNKSYYLWKDIDVKAWDIDMLVGLPQQEDRTSSGLFMLKYMELWDGYRLQKGFSQNLIDGFRPKLAAILVNSYSNEEKKNGSPEI